MRRTGTVVAIDPAAAKVRVQFADHDQVVSYWLPVAQLKTRQDKTYWMPDAGEHVECLMDEASEHGTVVGSIYSDADVPPCSDPDVRMTKHKDGSVESYNRQTHEWTIDVMPAGKITLKVGPSSIEITEAGIKIIGPRIDLNP